jgi:hypothetical protein
LRNRNRSRNRRNRIILTQEEWNRILALGSGSGSCCTKNIKLNLLWRDTGYHMHEAGEIRDKIMVTGRSFYCKDNLKFKGRNRNRNRGEKIGTRNRNLGKMARFHNTASRPTGRWLRRRPPEPGFILPASSLVYGIDPAARAETAANTGTTTHISYWNHHRHRRCALWLGPQRR